MYTPPYLPASLNISSSLFYSHLRPLHTYYISPAAFNGIGSFRHSQERTPSPPNSLYPCVIIHHSLLYSDVHHCETHHYLFYGTMSLLFYPSCFYCFYFSSGKSTANTFKFISTPHAYTHIALHACASYSSYSLTFFLYSLPDLVFFGSIILILSSIFFLLAFYSFLSKFVLVSNFLFIQPSSSAHSVPIHMYMHDCICKNNVTPFQN